MKPRLLRCLECDCPDFIEDHELYYCEHGIRRVEVERGQNCRLNKVYKEKTLPIYIKTGDKK